MENEGKEKFIVSTVKRTKRIGPNIETKVYIDEKEEKNKIRAKTKIKRTFRCG